MIHSGKGLLNLGNRKGLFCYEIGLKRNVFKYICFVCVKNINILVRIETWACLSEK